MECTIIENNGRNELLFGRQELTGTNARFYNVPEVLVEEIRTCDIYLVQSVIAKIKETCPEVF